MRNWLHLLLNGLFLPPRITHAPSIMFRSLRELAGRTMSRYRIEQEQFTSGQARYCLTILQRQSLPRWQCCLFNSSRWMPKRRDTCIPSLWSAEDSHLDMALWRSTFRLQVFAKFKSKSPPVHCSVHQASHLSAEMTSWATLAWPDHCRPYIDAEALFTSILYIRFSLHDCNWAVFNVTASSSSI